MVGLWSHERKQQDRYSVHYLVLVSFVGPRPEGMQACHEDGSNTNNHLSNLRWDTPKGNHADAVKKGTHTGFTKRGENNPFAKITEGAVLDIRKKGKLGREWIELRRSIAAEHGVSEATIQDILNRKSWKYL